MVKVFNELLDSFSLVFNNYSNIFSINGSLALNTLYFIIMLTVISFFIWKFYNSVSKMNLIDINLRQYNNLDHPIARKLFAVLLYMLEYMIVMPFLISLWFAGLTIIFWLLSPESLVAGQILVATTVLMGAIRITAYYKKKLSEDLAKLFPFVALATFLMSFKTLQNNFNGVVSNFGQIPLLLNNVFSYIVVIFLIEIFLRLIYTLYEFYKSEEEGDIDAEIRKAKTKKEEE